jgi:hypothetical protein
MSNKKQSSIDWLVEQLTEVDYGCINKTFLQINNSLAGHKLRELFEQAKAMHREDMGKTWDSALDRGQERAWNVMRAYDDFDEYYTETFGGQDNE